MKITLHSTTGNSDKLYIAEKTAANGLFLVNFAYGRRGGTLQTGTKTRQAVSEQEADKILEKLVSEKRAKGYREYAHGSTDEPSEYVGTDIESRQTAYPVQLLNPIDEKELNRLLDDDRYAVQEKHDGKRMVLIYENGNLRASNRKALECGYPQIFADAVRLLVEAKAASGLSVSQFAIDGEAVGERFFAFDLVELNETDLREQSFFKRWLELRRLLFDAEISQELVSPILTFCDASFNPEEKRRLFQAIKNRGGEGIVFKENTAQYQPGQPASGGSQLKFKLYQEATCIVASHHSSKSSISLQVRDANDSLVDVGNCKVPPNYDFPAIGEMVEIRYLYFFKGGSLYQPVYKGLREDKTEADRYDSLKLKPDTSATI